VRAQSTSGWFPFAVRANGVEFHQTCLRSCGEHPTNFEVVVRDRQLGNFAIHEEFLLEIQEGNPDNTRWRPVSLTELRDAIGREARITDSDYVERTSSCSSPLDNSQRQSHIRIERIPVEGDASHVDRVHAALAQARIRYQIVGGLDSRGRCRGHVTLAVPSLLGAGMCLRRAGFLESRESKYVLIDSRTGWKVRLLEEMPRRSN
jgi:hypothetical protein